MWNEVYIDGPRPSEFEVRGGVAYERRNIRAVEVVALDGPAKEAPMSELWECEERATPAEEYIIGQIAGLRGEYAAARDGMAELRAEILEAQNSLAESQREIQRSQKEILEAQKPVVEPGTGIEGPGME